MAVNLSDGVKKALIIAPTQLLPANARVALRRRYLARLELATVWASDDDCRFNMPRVLPDGRVQIFHVLFPDPWWKPQHQVKRLFSPPFVDLLAAKLAPGGLLYFKSDVAQYGEMVRYLVEQNDAFLPHDPTLHDAIGPYAPTHREHWCSRNKLPFCAYYFRRR